MIEPAVKRPPMACTEAVWLALLNIKISLHVYLAGMEQTYTNSEANHFVGGCSCKDILSLSCPFVKGIFRCDPYRKKPA